MGPKAVTVVGVNDTDCNVDTETQNATTVRRKAIWQECANPEQYSQSGKDKNF